MFPVERISSGTLECFQSPMSFHLTIAVTFLDIFGQV